MLHFFVIINLITFTIFALDKWKAVRHQRRISEYFLLTFTFFGGTIGAVLAMLIFRHKTSKTTFLLKTGLIILLQTAVLFSRRFTSIIQQLTTNYHFNKFLSFRKLLSAPYFLTH